MKTIRKAKEIQNIKKSVVKTTDMVSTMRAHATSCGGECYDCDSCGGSITH
mgnify:CR=1 FL=1